ncbi:MAG: sigma 54-interacting transcriptional regulator [Planctomycetes bacterium]|nr:sigma 54-interacting transcriptional regulator [Planctomycetota bacterium]
MTTILFLCSGNPTCGHIAEGFVRQCGFDEIEVINAANGDIDELHPLTGKVMGEAGIDISKQKIRDFSEVDLFDLDIVITLSSKAAKECSLLLPGHPGQVNWNLDDPANFDGDDNERLKAFRKCRDEIGELVENFFKRGYFKSLVQANNKADLILNSLTEGIIAHDMDRKIMYFNKAAEKTTGYSAGEVLGKDCHEVFPGNFCGNKCSFCGKRPSFDNVKYPITITTKAGEERQLEISVQGIKDEENDKMLGVLASFRDLTTEKDLARRLGKVESFSGIIGRDKKMLEVFDLIRSVANANVPVLVHGASGTGKELVAAAIHNESNRSSNLFVPVNCGALPEGLLESELFGHVKGAFTGAIRDKKGRFELADEGTIFLDEIGDISPAMQVKLLRVLQEGTFERVGDTSTVKVNVRIISATNKNLKEEIAEGRFREDLFYRLCVVPIELPPLRERCGDIPLLVDYILKRIEEESGRSGVALSPSALDALLSYEWPGNIRELQNALQFSLVKCRGNLIEATHLPPHILSSVASGTNGPSRILGGAYQVYEEARQLSANLKPKGRNKLDEESVLDALKQTGGNKAKAARFLGVGRATLYRFLDKNPQIEVEEE